MAEKNNANIGFEKQIWDAACVLWGHIPAAEYRKVIIGLIFLNGAKIHDGVPHLVRQLLKNLCRVT